MMENFEIWLENLLRESGVLSQVVPYLRLFILLMILVLVAYISFVATKKVVVKALYSFFERTYFKWDDVLSEQKVLNNLAHIVPAVIVKIFAPIIFRDFEELLPIILKLTDSYLIIAAVMVVVSFLKAMEFTLASSKVFADKPLASYFQLVRIIIYIAAGIFVLSVLMGRSPIYFISAFGAMTAILLLIFKDTILGLVASVQISSNDMIRVGDWVEMPKFNADGDVLAINLNTVKIENFDKTITTVPTYYFITDSFKNWRGMQESGGRRIKRPLFINVRSVKFVDPETRERFKKFFLIREYVSERQSEIENYNKAHDFDTSELINGRRMTNIGIFRQYILSYLKRHPHILQEATLLVRQLSLEDRGLPIEIYCFTNTVDWIRYEEIQSDIFDHLLAAASHFDIEIFQQPSGNDIVMAVENISGKELGPA